MSKSAYDVLIECCPILVKGIEEKVNTEVTKVKTEDIGSLANSFKEGSGSLDQAIKISMIGVDEISSLKELIKTLQTKILSLEENNKTLSDKVIAVETLNAQLSNQIKIVQDDILTIKSQLQK